MYISIICVPSKPLRYSRAVASYERESEEEREMEGSRERDNPFFSG